MQPIVDLRSDTVTRPRPAMKQAMLDAPLGDDVLGDDPTVQALEARAAALSGKEAALFVPSGTMANLLAIRCQTRLGDEVLLHPDSHPYNYEAGGAAAFAGVQLRTLTGPHGRFSPDAVRAAVRGPDPHFAPAALVCVEDTTNRGGGGVWPLEQLDAVGDTAHALGLRAHVDGARVMNAVVASGVPLSRRVKAFDSVAFCFSKGLGAPVGSVLAADVPTITLARRMRKLLGGGMRQSGMLAAAALYALEHHVERLAEDHARAQTLADGLLALGLRAESPETNMVYVGVEAASEWQDALHERGIWCFATAAARLRLVLHHDVTDAGVEATLTAFRAVRDQRGMTSPGA
jgi:threonine aldolase